MAPDRKADLAKVVVRAMIAGSCACFLTACIAGKSYCIVNAYSKCGWVSIVCVGKHKSIWKFSYNSKSPMGVLLNLMDMADM